jgi:hypothetical protein
MFLKPLKLINIYIQKILLNVLNAFFFILQ